jgi:L-glutamine-phosphate cytidylyltransferase
MRCIIPAAGLGSRLRPITDRLPKGLTLVRDKPLLWHSLERIASAGATEVIIICGYRADQLRESLYRCPERPRLSFVTNDRYESTNSIVSISLTRDWWSEPFCIIDGDVIADTALLARLLSCSHDTLVIDCTKQYEAIDMKAEIAEESFRDLGKQLPAERTHGEFFGLSYWSPAGAADLGSAIDRLLDDGCDHVWYEEAIREVATRRPLRALYAAGDDWVEVDCQEDLPAAERLVVGRS